MSVSIHLMFLLIVQFGRYCIVYKRFNTSHVSINLILYDSGATDEQMFQYISCFY